MQLQKYKLDNGMNLAVLPIPHVKKCCLMVDIYSGSRCDGFGFEGEHHAFEHILFRGTKKFPDKKAWAIPLERCGIDLGQNTSTTWCNTRYALEAPTEQLGLIADHLCDLVYHPLLLESHWKKEQTVILRESQENENQCGWLYMLYLLPLVFPTEHNMHSSLLGTPKSIKAINTNRLREIHTQDYTIMNSQLVLAGKINKKFLSILNKTFGKLQLQTGRNKRRNLPLPKVGAQGFSIENKFFEPSTLGCWGFFKIPDHRNNCALQMFQSMLGSGRSLSSPLFNELREKQNLLYGYDLSINIQFTGLMDIGFMCDAIPENIERIYEVFWKVVKKTYNDRERFEFVKQRSLILLSSQTFFPETEAENVADQLLYENKYISNYQYLNCVRSMSFEEVSAAAQEYFDPKKFAILVVHS